jgi:hypothetical protein
MIRGEYWIVDSDVWYADGTYGDTDHRTHALQYIRYVILMELGWNGESDSLCDGSVFREELIKTIGCCSMPDVLERLQADCAHPEQAILLLSAAFEYSEPREAVMRELGIMDSSPEEIAVFASGRCRDGTHAENLSVVLLSPYYEDKSAPMSKWMAELICKEKKALLALLQVRP